jgi:hypothetical protein
MSFSTITVGGNSVNLVAMPSFPGLRSVDFTISDAVGTVVSPFTGQVQTMQWPGADMLKGTMTLPSLEPKLAQQWIAFLMQLRGMSYAFQVGDPLFKQPAGTPSGTPVTSLEAPGSTGNTAMSQVLGTNGWTPSAANVLLPGDWIQVGFRLYRCLDAVSSDTEGNATFNIWPSLREPVVDGVSIVTENTQGLFRLSTNDRKFSFDITRLTKMSIPFQEYR